MKQSYSISHSIFRVVIASALLSKYKGRSWCIDNLYVNESYRRQGYGRAIMQKVIADADLSGVQLHLVIVGTLTDAEVLQRFYKSFGFNPENGLWVRACKT